MNYKVKLKQWAERREKMLKRLAAGESKSAVARAFGISRQRVHALASMHK